MIGILLVDDHPVVREGLASALGDQPDFQVIGAAESAEAALRAARADPPDVILLDLELPGASGVEAIPRLLKAAPGAKILVFTAYETDERVFGALESGAKGYLLKGASLEEIAGAVRVVHRGGSPLEPRIAARVLDRVGAPRAPAADLLTDREREVLRLLRDGLSNKRIGRELGISVRTVKFHVSSILEKLEAENRTQAVARAMERGLV